MIEPSPSGRDSRSSGIRTVESRSLRGPSTRTGPQGPLPRAERCPFFLKGLQTCQYWMEGWKNQLSTLSSGLNVNVTTLNDARLKLAQQVKSTAKTIASEVRSERVLACACRRRVERARTVRADRAHRRVRDGCLTSCAGGRRGVVGALPGGERRGPSLPMNIRLTLPAHAHRSFKRRPRSYGMRTRSLAGDWRRPRLVKTRCGLRFPGS